VAVGAYIVTSQSQGYLLVRFKGLPAGTIGTLHVSGNNGFAEAVVGGDAPAIPLPAGTYRVVAKLIVVHGNFYLPTLGGEGASQTEALLSVHGGATTRFTQRYTRDPITVPPA
jgi:hypothetical protein